MVYIKRSLFLILFVTILSCTGDKEQYQLFPIDSLMARIGTTHVDSFEGEPILDTQDPLISATNIIIPDYKSDKVLIYDMTGPPIRKIGRTGGGPGEFDMPYDAAISKFGDLYILDRGNNRVQILSTEGEYEDQIPIDRRAKQIHPLDEGSNILVFGLFDCEGKPCLMREYDPSGSIVNEYARVSKSKAEIESWVIGFGSNNMSYITHAKSSNIRVYDGSGEITDTISLTRPPAHSDGNLNSEGEDAPLPQLGEVKRFQDTRISSLYPTSSYLFVTHEMAPSGNSKYFTDIYSKDGDLLFHSVDTPGDVASVVGRYYYFTKKVDAEEGVAVTVTNYELHDSSPL